MEILSKHRVPIISAIIIVLVAIAVGVAMFQGTNKGNIAAVQNNIQNVDPSELPPGFPSGIPFFYKTSVLQNYTTSANGRIQATNQFIASSSAPVVFKMYENFFLKDGWNVTPQYHLQKASQKIFYARKGSEQATVIVDSVLTTSASGANAPQETIVTLNFFTNQ
jgi:hypothetical protein